MQKKLTVGLPHLVLLQFFTLFPEYFISVSTLYILIVVVLITYNVYGLMLQKAISECIALILLMACYLIINDDLLILNFATFNHSIINDYLAFLTKTFVCFFSAIYFWLIADSLKDQKLISFEYLLVVLFSVLGLMLMCSSNDLLTAYLAIELASLAFYILASFKKTSNYSVESGIKYFVIGAVSSAFFLLGSSLLYAFTGSTNFTDYAYLLETGLFLDQFSPVYDWNWESPFQELVWYLYTSQSYETLPKIFQENFGEFFYHIVQLENNSSLADKFAETIHTKNIPLSELFVNSFAEIGLTLVLFSLFIKLALAPFHLWSLDVYEGSPTSSTFFFAVITKLSLFVLLIRLFYLSWWDDLINIWQFYSVWIGVFSIFVGSFGGLKQRKLKTLLAYSSTSHMGYALIAFSTTTYLGIQMLLFYIAIYMISGLCVWSILLMLRLKKKNVNKYNKELGDLVLLKKSNIALSFALGLTMFSVAGIPPMIGFIAKINIFLSVIGISFYFIALVSMLCSVISTFYYIRILKVLYFENILIGRLYYPINNINTLVLSILVFFLIFLFINPTLLYLLTFKVLASFF